ncbi:MAG: peptide chain release factor N(5)-glutamine methyltransferase [Actinomycetota bacterium]
MSYTRGRALERLAQNLGTPSARVEAELLLRHVLGCSRVELYADLSAELSYGQASALQRAASSRRAGAPLQYVTGTQAFCDLELVVGPGVLVPRPETELVAQRCLRRLDGVSDPVVVDVGTGSGAIALYLASHRSDGRIWATDVSAEALEWARRNVDGLKAANVNLVECDLLAGLPDELRGRCDLVVSNPPYLSEAEYAQAPADVRDHEPADALVCGNDGLEVSIRLIAEALDWLRPNGALVVESGPAQAERLKLAVEQCFQGVTITKDLAGRARIIEGSKQ